MQSINSLVGCVFYGLYIICWHRTMIKQLPSSWGRKKEITLDWCFSRNLTAKGYFCSLLVSNIYWLTSLSTDWTIVAFTISIPKHCLIGLFHFSSARSSFMSVIGLGLGFVLFSAHLILPLSFCIFPDRFNIIPNSWLFIYLVLQLIYLASVEYFFSSYKRVHLIHNSTFCF